VTYSPVFTCTGVGMCLHL